MEITGKLKITQKKLKEIKSKISNVLKFKEAIEKVLAKEVTKILEVLIAGAINLEASDIHFEPEEKRVKIRVRLDGILHDVLFIIPKIYQSLISRLKLLSGIKLNITDRAQDGRISVFLAETQIELRVSTIPSEYGESVVMRILNPENLIEIEELGLREDMAEIFKKEIKRPNGMIIVTGPTGCGKTTTLYAILKRIQNPEIKIITIEDPIEYHLEGISQTQVVPEKGYDFANGLEAIMRQDPDVILVGEIRDFETAKIALQAALTGHLVLSTLHTNDAAGTVARFLALGEKPINIAPAINISVAQRLVRKVCQKCAEFKKPNKEEWLKLKRGLKSLPKKIKEKLKILLLEKNLKIPKAKGCSFCNFTGYKGRIGVFEFFLVDPEIENFILNSPSVSDLRTLAKKKGMITLKEDGLIKFLKGITTLEEIERVIGE
ncbi:MAG: GspE/PulE family protein [Patescibacteria group bacterium]|nr:GspE/PulE family protein [Patescibacteria group bacterium]